MRRKLGWRWRISRLASAIVAPPAWSVLALLHFDGSNGATDFTGQDATGRAWTGVGGASLYSTVKKFGPTSTLLTGGGYLTTPNTADLRFGTGDYCIDMWLASLGDGSYKNIFYSCDYGANQLAIRQNNQNKIEVFFNDSVNDLGILTSTGTIVQADGLKHVEVSRTSGVTRIFISGTEVATSFASYNVNGSTGLCRLGGWSLNASNPMNGVIDELRITNGGGHTGDFTPPIIPYEYP